MMNESAVDYVLIKNVNNELPSGLLDGKDIDIVVAPQCKTRFERTMQNNDYRAHTNPFGKANGWNFAYGLQEYQFWKKEGIPGDLYIDASFALCCKSLTPNIWIPLDGFINETIWKNRIFDDALNCWRMDDKNLLLYLLVRCIFDKRNFTAAYISDIEKLKHLFMDDYVRKAMNLVFFAFAPNLIDLVSRGRYESILTEHLSFSEY
jgi:hypothetical protein